MQPTDKTKPTTMYSLCDVEGLHGKLSDYDALMSDPKANSCSKQACWDSNRTRSRSLLRDSGIDVEVMVRWNEQLPTIVLPVIPTKQDRPDVN